MGKHEALTLRPTAKVLAGWLTGAGATTVTAVLAAVSDNIPQGTVWGVLAASVATGLASWLKRSRPADQEA